VNLGRRPRAGDPVASGLLGAPPLRLCAFEPVDVDPTGLLVRPAGSVAYHRSGMLGWLNVDGGTTWIDLRSLRPAGRVAFPEDFGARGDGVHDDALAIQLAANSLAATGGTVRFAARAYLCRSRVTLPARVNAMGEGRPINMAVYTPAPMTGCGTVLLSDNAADFSFFKLGHQSIVSDLDFDATSPAIVPAGGAVLDFSGSYGTKIEDVYANRAYRFIASIHAAQFAQVFSITRARASNVVHAGIELDYAVVGSVDDCFVYNMPGSPNYKQGAGYLFLNGTATIDVSRSTAGDMQDSFRFTGKAGASHDNTVLVGDIYVTRCCADTPARVGLWATSCINSAFIGNFFGGSDQTDIWLDGNSDALAFGSNNFVGSNLSSISLASTGLSGIGFSANHFSATNRVAGSPSPIFEIFPGVGGFSITGSIAKPGTQWGGSVGHFNYGARVGVGASNDYIIAGNIFAGATTGMVLDGGTGLRKSVTGNVGV
jgi:hypothetical protein